MANSIDNKVVSIEFNNASFESKIGSTLKSIEMLQKSLTFEGAKTGFADLSKAADGVTLNTISSGIEHVSKGFIALSAIGISALASLTSKAVDAGLTIAKSLTIEPITTGFAEYELKMGAIQTIMAGTGASLEQVNTKLGELNEYSDKTIYSFKDMTSNIGKFTNAGVSLDKSVAAIQGVANVAALSGATAEEASRSMYNFGQALSTGSVKLIDWKSIEFANMATVEFKNELLKGALAAGTLTGGVDGLYTTLEGTPVSATQGFNDSLQEQWLTAEALTDTLGRYADATGGPDSIGARATAAATEVKTLSQMMDTLRESAGSGWATSSELVFGDFNEAKALFSGMNDLFGGIIGASANARNAVLQDWRDLGGRDQLLQGLMRIFDGLRNIMKPIGEAFRDIFPRKTGEDLFRWSKAINDFGKALQELDPNIIKNLALGFKGFFAIVSIGWNIVKGVAGVIFDLVGLFVGGTGGGLLAVVGKVGAAFVKLHEILVGGGGIANFFDGISSAIARFVGSVNFGPIIEAFKKIKDAIFDFVGSIDFGPLIAGFEAISNAVKSLFNRDLGVPKAATESFSAFKQVISGVADIFQQIINKVGSFISGMSGATNAVGDGVSQVGKAVSDIFVAIGEAFESPDLNFDNVLKVAAGGLFGGLLLMINKFLKEGIKFNFGQFALLDELKDVLGGVTGNLKAMQTNIQADTLMKIAIALGVLTAAILVLSMIDGDKLAKAFGALAVGLIQLSAAMYGLTKMTEDTSAAGKFVLLAIGLAILAGAVLMLGLSARLLSGMGWEEISRGLYGVTGLLAGMAAAVKLMDDPKGMIGAGIGILLIAGSMLVLALAVKLMATLGWEEMTRGLVGVTTVLITLGYAMSKMPTSGMASAGLAILMIAGSLFVFGLAIKMFAAMDLVTVGEGLLYIGVTLAVIIKAMNAVDDKEVLKTAAALTIMAVALLLMAKAVEDMGSMSAGTIIKGVVGLGIVMQLLSTTMQSLKKTTAGNAITLFLLSMALGTLAGVLTAVGSLPFGILVTGLAGIAGVLGTIIGAGYLANGAVPGLLSMGAAIFLIAGGIGLLAGGIGVLGLGFKAFAEGLGLLAENGEAGLQAFIAMIDDLLLIVPTIAVALGLAAVAFAASFMTGFAELIPEVVKLLLALLEAIIQVAPKIWEAAHTIIIGFLKNFQVLYPEIVKTGMGMILALLRGIRDNIKEITKTAIGIVTEFINGMAEGVPGYVRAMVNLFTTIFKSLAFELGLLMVTLGPTIGIAFVDGILTGIEITIQKIQDFFGEWAGKILNFIKGLFGINSPSTEFLSIGTDLILGLLKGIVDTIGQVMRFFRGLAGDVLGWIGDLIGTLVSKGADLLEGLWTGITDANLKVANFFINLVTDILGWIGDVIGSLVTKGTDFIEGLWTGIWERVQEVFTFYTELATTIIEKIGEVATTLKDKGIAFIQGLWDGIWERVQAVFTWYAGLGSLIAGKVTGALTALKDIGRDLLQGLWDGIVAKWEVIQWFVKGIPGWITGALGSGLSWLLEVGKDIMRGLWKGIEDMKDWLKEKLGFLVDWLPGWVKDKLGITSPSKVFAEIGKYIPMGLAVGIEGNIVVVKDAMTDLSNKVTDSFNVDEKDLTDPIVKAMHSVAEALSISTDFNPTITPVLDLTQVARDAKLLKTIYPDLSSTVASNISASELEAFSVSGPGGSEVGVNVQFVQNNNSPKALSTNDIYRRTRNQLAIAKEELSIR